MWGPDRVGLLDGDVVATALPDSGAGSREWREPGGSTRAAGTSSRTVARCVSDPSFAAQIDQAKADTMKQNPSSRIDEFLNRTWTKA